MKRVAAAVIVVVGAVIVWLVVTGSEDEAPIIVKNGSMTIETGGEWQEDGGTWSHESGKGHQNNLWVRVDLTNGATCKGTGHPVRVDYSIQGFQAIFTVAGGSTPKTKVAPRAGLNRETPKRLRHGSQGDGGHITAVRIGANQLSCDITQNTLSAINICSSANVPACQ